MLDLLITAGCVALVVLSLYPRSVKAQVWARTLTFLGRPFASLVILIGGLSPSASDDEVAAAAAAIATTARGDKSSLSLSLLESAPEDVLSTILQYATAADLLATGAAAPSFVKACLCDAAPWTALRLRLPPPLVPPWSRCGEYSSTICSPLAEMSKPRLQHCSWKSRESL